MGQSGVEKHLQLLWKSTAMAPLLVGLAGCWWRPVEPPPIVTPAAPAPAPATPEVLSVADAEGKTHVTLPPRPDLHPGDVLHIRAADRLIATALVTVVDADHSEALVVALTDRRRPVQVHDTFGPPAPDADPPPADPAELARQQATSRIALSQALAAPAAPVTPPPVAPTLAMDAAVEHAPAATTTPTTAEAHADAARTPAAGPAPVEVAAPAVPAPDAGQEVRARLEAERAYWDLASRVLRLPPAGPELAALQERLRQEFAVQEAKEAPAAKETPAAKEAAQPAAKEAPKDVPAHDAAPAGATEAHEVKPATEPAKDAAAHEAKPETHEATSESHEAKPEAHDAKPSHDDAHAEHQDAKP